MILPLEQQVSSLEPSTRLKELGVRQESVCFYVKYHSAPGVPIKDENKIHLNFLPESWQYGANVEKIAAAFTVAELGEMLPRAYSYYNDKFWRCLAEIEGRPLVDADTEADARAKMLIYLIENKLITLEKET